MLIFVGKPPMHPFPVVETVEHRIGQEEVPEAQANILLNVSLDNAIVVPVNRSSRRCQTETKPEEVIETAGKLGEVAVVRAAAEPDRFVKMVLIQRCIIPGRNNPIGILLAQCSLGLPQRRLRIRMRSS